MYEAPEEHPIARLVAQFGAENHEAVLCQAMDRADEILVSVAFLKTSGLERILGPLKSALARGATARFYVGLSDCVSDPAALRKLKTALDRCEGCALFLCDPPGQRCFHPKMYYFGNAKAETLVVGSANLTSAGLGTNFEASVAVLGRPTTAIGSQMRAALNGLESEAWTKRATEFDINRYERKYQIIQKARNAAEQAARRELADLRGFDIEAIRAKYLSAYFKDKEQQRDFAERESHYRIARDILVSMSEGGQPNHEDFLADYGRLVGLAGQGRLWHSDGLQRQKARVAADPQGFIDLVKLAVNTQGTDAEYLFALLSNHVADRRMSGVGVNVVTEIMNTLAPERFPVLNKNPYEVLRFFGFKEFPGKQSFKPWHYGEYAKLMMEIAAALEFNDLGRLDHFMNYVYWREGLGGRQGTKGD